MFEHKTIIDCSVDSCRFNEQCKECTLDSISIGCKQDGSAEHTLCCNSIRCKHNAQGVCAAPLVSVIQQGRGKNNTRCHSFSPAETGQENACKARHQDQRISSKEDSAMKDFVRQPPQRNSPVKCTAVDCKYNVCFRCRYPAALQFQRVIGAWEAPICKWYGSL